MESDRWPDEPPERLTETQWLRRRALRKCKSHGHAFDQVIEAGEPITLFCERCGRRWGLIPK